MKLFLVCDFHWHWIDGSIGDDSVITWCPNSTYKAVTDLYCAAYDTTLQCVNNYLCNTKLPAPCVSGKVSLFFVFFFFVISIRFVSSN